MDRAPSSPIVGPRAPERPLLRVALALAAGTLAGQQLACASPHLAPRLLVLVGLAAWLGLGRRLGATRRAAVVLGLLAALRVHAAPAAPEPGGSGIGERAGTVCGVWTPRSLEAVAEDDLQRGTVDGLPLGLPPGLVAAGEHVRIEPGAAGRLAARGPLPPARGPSPSVTPVHPDEVVRCAPAQGGIARFWPRAQALRARLLVPLERMADQRAAAFLAAFVLGLDERLSFEERDLFTRTGVRHMLAVSGWHVGLLYLLALGPLARALGALARRLGARGSHVESLAGALLALAYAVLAGGAAPVRRAALALSLARAAELVPSGGLPRRVDSLSLLSFAWIVECAFARAAPSSLSAQLSYLATLGIVLGARPLAHRFAAALPQPAVTFSPFRAASAAVLRRAARATLLALATSCVAVAATLPVCWSTFGEWSPCGIFATVLLAPVYAWLLACGAFMLCLPGLLPEALFAVPTGWLFTALQGLDRLPGTPWPLPSRPTLLVAAACAAWLASLRVREAGCGRVAALAAGILVLPWTPSPRSLEVVACDVGHGTAVLVRAPGGAVWVFDAGSRDRTGVGREALAPLLSAWEASAIHVVASHSDRDHTLGLHWLALRYPPAVWMGALPAPPGQPGERLPHTTLVMDLQEGWMDLPARGPLRAALLRGGPLAGNEGSRSLLLELGGQRVLLCGDAEGEGLARTLRLVPGDDSLDLLLLPHHGSDSPWLVPLLERGRPAEVWISAAGRPAVAAELDRRGVVWRWTGRDGALTWHGTR